MPRMVAMKIRIRRMSTTMGLPRACSRIVAVSLRPVWAVGALLPIPAAAAQAVPESEIGAGNAQGVGHSENERHGQDADQEGPATGGVLVHEQLETEVEGGGQG